jgi:hypothetical protein
MRKGFEKGRCRAFTIKMARNEEVEGTPPEQEMADS